MRKLVVLLVMVVAGNVVWAEDPVYFADTNLKTAVEEALGVTDPLPSDMLLLNSLDASGRGITVLTGIEYAINLTSLNIGYNQIIDISLLTDLTNLTYLKLSDNPVGNISSLENLEHLESLGLENCQLNDIAIVANLTSLTDLNIGYNDIDNILPLADMTNLTYLKLSGNPVGNISSLENLEHLESLGLENCQLNDIAIVANLTSLTDLNIGYNDITDIQPLADLTNLTYLKLSGNVISDISHLENLTSLEVLAARSCGLNTIEVLSGLANLTELGLPSNAISDVSPLVRLNVLDSLKLSENPLDLSAYCIYLPLVRTNNPGINLAYNPNPNPSAGDCNGDCRVNFGDVAILASHWMELDCAGCGGAEQTGDGDVLEDDLAVVAENWLGRDFFKFEGNTLDNEPDWIIEGQWEFGQPSGLGGDSYGNPDPTSGFTGSNVFGVNLNGDYDASTPSGPYYLIAGPFNCTYLDNVNLKFARWLNTDESAYARSFVEASNNGTTWEPVWEYNGRSALADNTWQTLEYDISTVADGKETVYIRWGYEVLDYAYPYSGWNIDDVELWGNPNL